VLPGRRPSRSGGTAGAAAHLRGTACRGNGADPPDGVVGGLEPLVSGQGPISYWLSTADLTPRAALPGSTDADVVVIGAGFTGLWTAYYLAAADPGLRIVVLEAQVAGYGASGRNGGWCSALFPASLAAVARKHGVARASALV